MYYRVHFKVDELSSGERDHNLAAVDRASDDGLLARGLPLVDSFVLTNVTDALGIDLKKLFT